MSISAGIHDYERDHLGWIEIRDDAGAVHRYVRDHDGGAGLPAHVTRQGFPPNARLVLGPVPFGRDEPGLPEEMGVDLGQFSFTPNPPGATAYGGWGTIKVIFKHTG